MLNKEPFDRPVGPVAQYLYDADGNRVREVYEDRVVYSIRGLNNELITQETHVGSDQIPIRTDYIYHNGSVLAEYSYTGEQQAVPKFVFRDRLGSPVVELTGPDNLPTFFEYSPYGHQMRTDTGHPHQGRLEFTSHERDANTAHDYMGARYYDPTHGNFNRPDPAFDFNLVNPASYNLYLYGRGNPINYVDPSGTQAQEPDFLADLAGKISFLWGRGKVVASVNPDEIRVEGSYEVIPKKVEVAVAGSLVQTQARE